MMMKEILLIVLAFTSQLSDGGRSKNDITNVINDAKLPATRTNALEKLMMVAEDTTQAFEVRLMAIRALGDFGAPAGKAPLKTLAMQSKDDDANSLESQRSKQLAAAATKAYWQLAVAELDSAEEKKQLFLRILRDDAVEPKSVAATDWAVNELAALGDGALLPELLDYIHAKHGQTRGVNDWIWATKRKVELIANHESRFSALKSAFEGEDKTQQRLLRRWAVNELADIGTPQAEEYLVSTARRLQQENYDASGKRVNADNPVLLSDTSDTYHWILEALRSLGWSNEKLNSAGLFPEKFFIRLH